MKRDPGGIRQVIGSRSGTSGVGGVVVLVTTINSPSSGIFTPNAGTLFYVVYGCGGGGGGGGVGATTGDAAAGGGGGGGGYFELRVFGRRKGQYTVGAGGAGGASGVGAAGSQTLFSAAGVDCVAPGGHAGSAGGTAIQVTAVQAHLPAEAADVKRSPEHGKLGFRPTTTLASAGTGGSNPLGQGGRGLSVDGAGAAGTGFGGGGGGGCGINSGAARAGGAGSNGVVIVVEYA